LICSYHLQFFLFSQKYRFSVDTNVVSHLFSFFFPSLYNDQIYLVTDRRTFKDRRDVWASEKKSNDFVAERPKAKIKQVSQSSDDGAPRKTKRSGTKQKSEEKTQEELVNSILFLSLKLNRLFSSLLHLLKKKKKHQLLKNLRRKKKLHQPMNKRKKHQPKMRKKNKH
jgi:hypothetical protein